MNKIKCIIFFLVIIFQNINAQTQQNNKAKRPIIMVIPSDNWCKKNGFLKTDTSQGKIFYIPDYKKALIENVELHAVISKIGQLMAERGFPLKDLEQILKSIENDNTELLLQNSKSGANIVEDPIDKINKVAKADIIIQISFEKRKENGIGPKNYLYFDMQGFDAYTNKQIAAASGSNTPTFSNDILLLSQEAVLTYLDNFNVNLQNHFEDILKNGREVVLNINVFSSSQVDLEQDINGKELNELITEWVENNVTKGLTFSTTKATASTMRFEQVRIPLFDNNNKALDTRTWARGLQKYLSTNLKIESKLTMKGLGEARLIIGEK